jgi:hypothetical protein
LVVTIWAKRELENSETETMSAMKSFFIALSFQRFASKELEEKLTSLGIEKNIIKDRIARLTPNELQDLNDKIDKLPAGGDAVVVVAAIFVLLLITDILGFTDIFSFTRPTR